MVQIVKEHPAACQCHSFSVVQSRMCSPLALINQSTHLYSAHVTRVLEYKALDYLSTWVLECLGTYYSGTWVHVFLACPNESVDSLVQCNSAYLRLRNTLLLVYVHVTRILGTSAHFMLVIHVFVN